MHLYAYWNIIYKSQDMRIDVQWNIIQPEKASTSVSLTTLKHLTMWITINCGKFLKRGEYLNTLPASWEICMQVKKQQLEPGMEQYLHLCEMIEV